MSAQMRTQLRQEITLLAFCLLILLIIGVIIGKPWLLVSLGAVAYLWWTFYNLKRLTRWLGKQGKRVPETYGIWDDIYYQLYQLYQRQRKVKRKLTAIASRFQESTQALPYATIVLNRNMEIEWFNNAAQSMFNLIRRSDIGQRVGNLIRRPEFISYLKRSNFKEDLELDYGQCSIRITITPYGRNQYLLGAHDITQRRKLEVMRRDFTANASHELRTPLTVISGYVEALQGNADDKLKIPLQRIHEQAERMESILNDLITLSRLETQALPDKEEIIDLQSLMQQLVKEMEAYDRGGHQFEISSEPVRLLGSREELHIVLVNLTTNAIRYSEPATRVKIANKVNAEGVCITVEDQGIGIPQEHISRLTERFYRVDPGRSREHGGTGLGLAVVKHILDRHNARLEISSKPGEGSVFQCCFPASQIVKTDTAIIDGNNSQTEK